MIKASRDFSINSLRREVHQLLRPLTALKPGRVRILVRVYWPISSCFAYDAGLRSSFLALLPFSPFVTRTDPMLDCEHLRSYKVGFCFIKIR